MNSKHINVENNLVLLFFGITLSLFLVACQPSKTEPLTIPTPQVDFANYSTAAVVDTKEYIIQERLRIKNHGPGETDKHNLWIALISDNPPYQHVLKMVITPDNYKIVTDEYGNKIAEFDFSGMPSGSEITVKIDYLVNVNHLLYDLTECVGDLPVDFTQPELHVESNNPQIVDLMEQLSADKHNPCEVIRAFYDYIGDKLVYSYNGKDWGAQAALGEMGADCTEYSSLMMALSRAAGIPARYLEGLYYTPEDNNALARTEHAWLEVYLPGIGWTPMDPTLGRSSITREDYFATLPPNHIIVTRGRNSSVLRGKSYWTHIYWPGNSTAITVEDFDWLIREKVD